MCSTPKEYKKARKAVKQVGRDIDDAFDKYIEEPLESAWDEASGVIMPLVGAALLFTPFAPIGAGMLWGSAISGGIALASGGDWAAVNDALTSGAITGAVTGGVGVIASGAGKAAASMIGGVGKAAEYGGKAVSVGTGVAGGYGAGKALGYEDSAALTMGLGAGSLGYSNFADNFAAQQEWNSFLKQLQGSTTMDVSQFVDAGFNPMNSYSMMDTINRVSGALTMGFGTIGPHLDQAYVHSPTGSGMQPDDAGGLSDIVNPLNSIGPKNPVLPAEEGAGWDRDAGNLFGGVDTLQPSLPKIGPKTKRGVSDEMLMRNGALA